ncbi:MAG: amino acid adenylation domain-containing protein, partial [Acidobacteriota bacterium]
GILGAGGAYVPLDPDYPADRLSYMLENSAAPVLVSQEHLVPRLPAHPEVLRIGNGGVLEGASDPVDGAPPLPRVDPSQVACILYTSGSTGRPKGVELTQLGIARLADGAARRIPVARRVHGQLSTISFDAASLEIWTALLGGGRLVGITRDDSVDPARLRRRLETQGIESLVVPTALFNQLVRQKPDLFDGVESVVVGGERADADVMRATQKAGPRRLYNAYGPTECSTIATWYEVPTLESDATSVPIGQPYDDTDIYVLGRDGRPCPYGVPGELCLGGEGLARGYVGQRAQTAERFVPHPFADGLRLYRTGDLVRFLEGGVLDFLGRVDHQVKIRGFRIEPGEIEAVLGQHRSVEAQSVAVQRDRGGLQRLVAFVVAVDPDAPPTATELRGFLRERLPEFMLPSSFPVLGQLPLTPNGKVDRGALPHFELLVEPEEVVEPRTETERALGAIWTDVLSRERVGVDDNFFELGGHSLLATQVLARMRGELGVDLTLREFFQRPTLAGLAEAVDGEGPGGVAPELKPVSPDADGTLPLSFDQERLWFLDRLEPGTATYLVPLALRLRGDLDTEALGLAFRVLVERHAVLRSRFVGRGGEGRVRVLALAELKADGPLLPHLDAGGESAEALAEAYARKSVDLETGPPFHAALARLGTRDYLFLLTLHHIVVDGESVAVVLQELEASYLRFTGPSGDHVGDPLPPLAVQFTDFAAWQRSRLTEESLDGRVEGWRRRLRGAPKLLELPTDRPRPAVQRHRGALVVRDLGEGLGSDLRDVARSSGTTPFVMALASFKILLSRLTHQRDLVVGSPVAGRELPQLEDLVGFFVGNLVLRTDLTGDPTFAEIVRRTQDTVLDAIADREVPFEKLVEALRPEQARGHHPFYQVTFQISDGDAVGHRFGPLHKELVIADSGSAKLDLSVHLRLRADGGATAEVEYDLDLLDGATVGRWLTAYARLLRSALGDRGQRLSHLPMLGDDARRQLRRWNDTDVDLPLRSSIPQLFARQVAARGDAVAVVHGSQVLTYRELEDRSRRLAAALVRRGVGPGDYVGLCMPRSADAMVAMLAILEAGGAYVPLGPEYPEDRLSFMLSDIGASVVVAQRDLADSLPSSAPLAFYDELMLDGAAGPADPPFPAVDGGFPALLVYTSGSTGRPKGVVVPHRAVTRLVLGSGYHDFDPGDRICQASTINFDAATFEIWGALLHGARTVIFDRGQLLDPAQFESEIDRTRADVLFLTTALFQDLARRAPRLLGKLRVVLFGGERCDPKAVAAALQKGAERTVHVYGPSEVTTFTTAQTVAAVAEDAASIPIGHAIANTHLHVVDPVGRRVDIGVDGELWIGGDGVAAGYLNRPAMTAERFVPDPFGERPGQRLYRSGDLVRRLGDGTVDFVGRTDHQIKLRGFRIELGEIEVALARRPEVDGQLAMVREDLVGDPRLAAYVTLRCAAGDDVDAIKGTILAGLAAELPEFMLPSTLTVLETFPLTANGKVDRRALPTPEVTANAEGTHRAPDSALAAAIADIWAETLGVEGVGLDDDFFKLGGHSLLATKVLARLCDLVEMDLPLLTLFESPVLQEFVARIDAELRRTTEGQEALALLEELHGMSDDEAMELLDGEDSAD